VKNQHGSTVLAEGNRGQENAPGLVRLSGANLVAGGESEIPSGGGHGVKRKNPQALSTF